jgi:hypothetical protein
MSEVDRLSNSGLYPALPIADKRSSRDDARGSPREHGPDKPAPSAHSSEDPAAPRPPKSLIDEYA